MVKDAIRVNIIDEEAGYDGQPNNKIAISFRIWVLSQFCSHNQASDMIFVKLLNLRS